MKNVTDTERELERKIQARITRFDELPVVYANLWSRLLFGRAFRLQFPIPVPQPGWMKAVLGAWEKRLTPPDLESVPIRKPIFVVGLPRSGTTLLHYLLSYHPRAAFLSNVMNTLPETILAIERARRILHLNISGDRHLRDSIKVDFTSPTEPIMHWQHWTGQSLYDLGHHADQTLDAATTARMRTDIRKVLLASGVENPRFACKYPYFSLHMPMLQSVFPDAKFVHIVRSPDAVAHSMIKLYLLIEHQRLKVKHPTVKTLIPYPRTRSLSALIGTHGPESLTTTATVWKETLEQVRADRPKISNFFEIRYEDLVTDPGPSVDRLLRFCELDRPDKTASAFWTQFDGIGKLRHENRYSSSPEIWRIAGEVAREYGYREGRAPEPTA